MPTSLSHVQKLTLQKNDAVMRINGQREDGSAFFVYVQMSKAAVDQMMRDQESGAVVDVQQYGTVLLSGDGEPTEEQIAYMRDTYDFNEDGI